MENLFQFLVDGSNILLKPPESEWKQLTVYAPQTNLLLRMQNVH